MVWGDAMVDPGGAVYHTEHQSHPDWAHRHRALVGFVGSLDGGYAPVEDEADAVMDAEGRIALDYFMEAGWIRVKYGAGVELYCLGDDNVDRIKVILRVMAKLVGGRTLHVDTGSGIGIKVPVSMTGRPDFRELDAAVR